MRPPKLAQVANPSNPAVFLTHLPSRSHRMKRRNGETIRSTNSWALDEEALSKRKAKILHMPTNYEATLESKKLQNNGQNIATTHLSRLHLSDQNVDSGI